MSNYSNVYLYLEGFQGTRTSHIRIWDWFGGLKVGIDIIALLLEKINSVVKGMQ